MTDEEKLKAQKAEHTKGIEVLEDLLDATKEFERSGKVDKEKFELFSQDGFLNGIAPKDNPISAFAYFDTADNKFVELHTGGRRTANTIEEFEQHIEARKDMRDNLGELFYPQLKDNR